jgi:hypothetical protein
MAVFPYAYACTEHIHILSDLNYKNLKLLANFQSYIIIQSLVPLFSEEKKNKVLLDKIRLLLLPSPPPPREGSS